MDSQVPPWLWMLLAWLTERHTDISAVDNAERRPSGRPNIANVPRTTRWVWRCTKWSDGLPLNTFSPAILYDTAKHLLKKASAHWETFIPTIKWKRGGVRQSFYYSITKQVWIGKGVNSLTQGISPITTVLPTILCRRFLPWKIRIIMIQIWGNQK